MILIMQSVHRHNVNVHLSIKSVTINCVIVVRLLSYYYGLLTD